MISEYTDHPREINNLKLVRMKYANKLIDKEMIQPFEVILKVYPNLILQTLNNVYLIFRTHNIGSYPKYLHKEFTV